MRSLTIERRKKFVACLGKMKVYVESLVGDTVIGGVACAKLGELKNGQTETFYITEDACRVYVISDRLSKGYSHEFYQLEAGTEPVHLTGENRFDLSTGHAYRFDNNQSTGIAESRKKGKTIGIIVLVFAALVGFALGFWANYQPAASPKTFTYENMHITLTDRYKMTDFSGYTVCFDSSQAAVFCLEEKFSLMAGLENYTLIEYAQLVMEANDLKDARIKTNNGLTYFEYEYTDPATQDQYHYFAAVYKEKDAFWLVQFAAPVEDMEVCLPLFDQWARSVTFD